MHYSKCNHALQFLQIFFSCFPDFLRRGPCVRHRKGCHSTWKPFHMDQVFHIDHNHTCHISHGHGLDHTHAFHIQHGSNAITHTNVFDFSPGPSAIKVTHFTNGIPLLLISPNPEPKPKRVLVHCCPLSLWYLNAEMIIAEIQISIQRSSSGLLTSVNWAQTCLKFQL